MANKLFNKKLPKICKNCIHSHDFGSPDELLCQKRGAVSYNDLCRKYKYDATKREPHNPVLSKNYTKEEFLL